MNCDKIQKVLNEFSGQKADLSEEILNHLSQCDNCSQVAKRVFKLDEILQTVANEPDSDLVPIEQRMRLVTREVESSGWLVRLTDYANRLADTISFGHGRLAMYSSLLTMILVFVTLVPFGYNQVVGYNLTLGGICPEVADDSEIVCALLFEHGISQAVIDVTHCDTTCSLVLFDLQSEREIELAMATYEELGATAIIENIDVVTDRASRSLLQMAKERLF